LKLFGTAGIRLKYPDEMDPVLAYSIGLAVASLNLAEDSYIVYDSRTTSHLFTYSFASGLLAGGVSVYIAGLAPTPVAAWAARKHHAIGVSVTASHNPPEYNGFKLYDPYGYEFTRELETAVEQRVEKRVRPVEWSRVGSLYYRSDLVDRYIEELINAVGEFKRSWSPAVVIDVANGAAGGVTPRVARALGAKPITVNAQPDGFYPVRAPEPRKDVLEAYLSLYSSVNPAVILAHDGDADRLAVLDPVKGFIRQDRVIAFYARKLLEDRKGVVIVSVDTGRVVDHVVERMGGRVERYMLGKTHERVKELGAENVVLAAEPWKLIDPRWGPWVDGVWQAALIIREVVEAGKPFSKILDDLNIPDYPWDRRSYVVEPLTLRDKLYEEVVEELKGLLGEPISVLSIDGYRFEYDDGSWVLVRKSGTEPKIRVYAEALTADRLRTIIEKVESRILYLAEKLGGRVVERTIG